MIESGRAHNLVDLMHKRFRYNALNRYIPYLDRIAASNLIPPITKLKEAVKEFARYGEGIAKDYDETLYEEGAKNSLIHSLLNAHKTDPLNITLKHVGVETGAIMV